MSLKPNQLDTLIEKAKGLIGSTLVIRNKALQIQKHRSYRSNKLKRRS